LKGRTFEVNNISLWRDSFSLPFSEDVILPGSVGRYEIGVPIVQDVLQDINFLLEHLGDEEALLRNLQACSPIRVVNLLRGICLLGIRKDHPLLHLVISVHSESAIEKLARDSFVGFCAFCEHIQKRYPIVQNGLQKYVSLFQPAESLGVGLSRVPLRAMKFSVGRGLESVLKEECSERLSLEARRMAFVPKSASLDSDLSPDTADFSGRCSPVDDVDLDRFAAYFYSLSGKKSAVQETACFNDLITCDLQFLNAALKKVCDFRCFYKDELVHILAQSLAYKYREAGGYDPDYPQNFIILFELWDKEFSSIADSLKIYMYLFLPYTERKLLSSYLTDYLSVEGFVRQNPDFRFLQGQCSEIIEICPTLPRLFKMSDLRGRRLIYAMSELSRNCYGPFWGALVDRGASKQSFSWQNVWEGKDIELLRRMPMGDPAFDSDPSVIDPNTVVGEMYKPCANENDVGMPILTFLAINGNEKLVQELLDKGANPFLSIDAIWKIYLGQQHNESMKKICALVALKAYQINEVHALRSPIFKNEIIIRELFLLELDPFSLIKHLSLLKKEIRKIVIEQAYAVCSEQLFDMMRYGSSGLRSRIFKSILWMKGLYRLWHINQKMRESVSEVYGRRSSEVNRVEGAELRRAQRNRRRVLPGAPERHYSVDDASIYPAPTLSLEELERFSEEKIDVLREELRRDDPETWVEPRAFELPSMVLHAESSQGEYPKDFVPCSRPKKKKGCCTIL